MPRSFTLPPQAASITFNNQRIDYTLLFRSRRTIGFAVRPDGSVRVTAPAGTSAEWVASQVLKKAAWILKHQASFRMRPPAAPARQYEAGATHFFLGEPYTLRLLSGQRPHVQPMGPDLLITTPEPPTAAALEDLLHAFYARQGATLFAASFARIWPRFAEFNLPLPALFVRRMRTRWGSCTPSRNCIRLSTDLVRASEACIDYVMLHECCHLLVPDHSAAFYELQTRLMPDWERWKRELNGLPR
ncbi:SprT family zinc-dependent metalloprotease [Hymenobacter saemangeumensis]|uniref:SprT family zinc-dependent metalloprotease n=1 Tax=Hymenobacter saemangeumensis TaxID=1084522 RepID=A0ABP8I9M8_9BACT